MNRSWYARVLLTVALCGLAAHTLYPSYFYFVKASQEQRDDHQKFCDALPSWSSCAKFNLGLDLQGGVHLVMGVKVEKAVQHKADRLAEALREGLKENKYAFTRVDRPRHTSQIIVAFAPETDLGDAERYLRRDFNILDVFARADKTLTLTINESDAKRVRDTAVEQTIKTIRNRADKLGVTEPTIARRGTENILIQLPGVKDPQRAITLIGKTAQLEFKIVDEEATAVFDDLTDLPPDVKKEELSFSGPGGQQIRDIYFTVPNGKKEVVRALLEPLIANDREIAFGAVNPNEKPTPEQRVRSYLLHASPGITGDYLTDAFVSQNPDIPSESFVSMNFDTKGAKIFAELTDTHTKRHMAVVLDGTVNSAPIIEGKIAGGSARITMGSAGNAAAMRQQAQELSLVLKAGALPAPVEIREQRRVGQTLGTESIEQGTRAIAVGGLLVFLFMLLYYRGSGVIANSALLLNIFFVLAILAMFEATLTLPGMAGIVLTIGMAVDANVIIFERIREELRIGKTPRAAIEAGYGRAFSTIMDANITTLIAGVVLMEYGSGPVRGFAVTLIIGIICSMFTAIVVTRLVFDFFTSRRRLQSLSI